MKSIYFAYPFQSFALVLFATILSKTNSVLAQASNIVPDDTLGEESSQVIENFNEQPVEVITGGAQREQNLFHSFQEFNVSEGRGAYFNSPNVDIQNIFSRVTGSNPSEIMGVLGTFGESSPDLYLVNPNGIIFGENAALNVQGSFTATTADGIRFGEQGEFNTINPQAPQLLTINPSAYLFNQVAPGAIVNNSRASADFNPAESFDDNYFGLRVPDGQNLLLLGGDVNVDGGGIVARGGRIDLGAVTGQGVIGLNNNGSLNIADSIARGDVSLTNGAGFLVGGDGGGDIALAAKNIDILSGSSLNAGIFSSSGSPNAQAGDITIDVTENFTVDNSIVANLVNPEAVGNAGNIKITTGSLNLTSRGRISATTAGEGDAGNINLNIQDNTEIFSGEIFSNVESGAVGSGGNLEINTNRLLVQGGGFIAAAVREKGSGRGGKLTVNATESIEIIGTTADGRFSSGLSTETQDSGIAGDLEIATERLIVRDGGTVKADTSSSGKGGTLTINASEMVKVLGGATNFSSGISADTSGSGDAGNIILETKDLVAEDGGFIGSAARASSTGNAGNIMIDASDSIELIGRTPGRRGRNLSSRISASVLPNGSGDAGNVFVETQRLSIGDGAAIFVSNLGSGQAGTLSINATDTIEMFGTSGGGDLNVATGFEATGQGGNLTIETGRLSIRDGSQVLLTTLGKANAGTIEIKASNSIEVTGISSDTQLPSQIDASSGLAPSFIDDSLVQFTPGFTGQGGDIVLQTGSLILKDNARINAAASGPGDAGNIFINVDGLLAITDANISTETLQSSGGGINIAAKDIRFRKDSDIRTNVDSGINDGGNITINADSVLAFDDSDIFAFAADGQGGNITIDTPAFFAENFTLNSLTTDPDELDLNARADVNATGAVSGAVEIPDVSFIQNSLTELPNNSLNTDELVANSCVVPAGSRSQGKFIITGGESLPVRPGGNLPSKYPTGEVRGVTEENTSSWQPGDPIIEPQGAYRLANGKLVLSRECSQ